MRHGKHASSPQTIVRLPQNPRSTLGPFGSAAAPRASRDLLCSTALSSAAAAVVLGAAGSALANPTGGEVVAGSARISTTPKTVTVDQASDRAVINWNTFSIGQGETTRFNQPGPSSIALNRVLSPEASRIAGTLSANGQVVIMNGAGVIFTPTAQLNVGGITATTAGMSSAAQARFMAGAAPAFDIAAKPGSAVVNEGRISVAEGGYAAFVAPTVRNAGVIEAKLGKVTLAGAEKFTLDLYGDDLVKIAVPEQAASELRKVESSGRIEGTTVALTVDAVKGLVDGLINVSGTVQARSATMEGGKIVLRGGAGTLEVAGKLDAAGTGAGTRGGTVELTADKVALASTATIDASGEAGGGTVLVGGNWQGKGPQQKASQTVMATGAKIRADAKKSGDGGTVVLWSEETTRVGGAISAKGGAKGGNGGKVETSGKKKLVVAKSATVDTSAASGKTGTWLLDPADIEIKDVGASAAITFNSGTLTFEPDSASDVSVLDRDQLQNQLAQTNVVVTTTNSGTDGAGNGDIKVTDSVTWTSGKSLSLVAARDILIGNTIDGGTGSLALDAGRHIDDGAAGQIKIGTLSASAGGSITLDNAGHLIGTLGQVAGAGVVINDSADGLRIAGAVDGGASDVSIVTSGGTLDVEATVAGANVQLATTGSGDIALEGAVTAAGALTLNAAGNVTQAAALSAGTLKGTVGGSATLGDPANAIGSLGDFQTGTGFELVDAGGLDVVGTVANTTSGTLSIRTAGNLAVAGTIDGQDVVLAATGGTNGISLGGSITASGTLTLDAAGDVMQTAAVAAGTLKGTVGGSATLGNSGNAIGSLGAFSTGSGLKLVDANGGLIVAGAVSAATGNVDIETAGGALAVSAGGTVTATAADIRLASSDGGITLGGGVTANGALTLEAAGDATQTAALSAGMLKGTVGGSATLDHSANAVASLGDFQAGTGFALADTGGLDVAGVVKNTISGTLSLSTAGGDLAVTGAIDGQNVALAANGGTSGITLGGTVTATGTLTLNAAGGVAQTAALEAGTLQGTVGGSASLDQANKVATLGAFSTGGGLRLVDSTGGLTISGAVSAATGNVDIETTGGDLATMAGGTVTAADVRLASSDGGITLGGGVTASGTLTLDAAGDVTQTAALEAGTLAAATANGSIRLDTVSNDVAALGAITAKGGGFAFKNGNHDLTLTATVQTRKDGGAPISIDLGTGALDTAGNAIESREATTTNIAAGAISLTADTIDLGTVADRIRTTGTVTLRPTTTTRSIGVAGGPGGFNLSAGELGAIADGAASIVIGRSKDDGGAHEIVIGGGAPVTFRDAMVFNAAASGGSITVAAGSPISSTAALTFNGSGATTTLNADIVTAGAKITIDDAVVLGADVELDATNGGGAAAGADVTITGTTTGNGNDLTLAAGTTGIVSLVDVAGIGTLTLASSASSTFGAVGAATVALQDTVGVIAFDGTVTIGTLTTANKGYSVAFNAGGTIANAATFLNTGTVTLGNEDIDGITFASGLDTTGGPAATIIQGTVAATNAPLTLGATEANGTATLNAGSGSIAVGAVRLADGAALTLRTNGGGTVTAASIAGTPGGAKSDVTFDAGGAVSVAGSVGTDIGTLTVADSGGATFAGAVDAATVALADTAGAIVFDGAVTIGTLTTASKGYDVAFNGGGTVAGKATFLNTGKVLLGDENGDGITFEGGLDTSLGVSETVVQGTVATSNTLLKLGATKANGTATLDAGTGDVAAGAVTLADGAALTLRTSGAGTVTAGSIRGTAGGAASDVTFAAGGTVSVTGTVGTDIGTLRVANSGGATFGGAVEAATTALDDTTGTIAFNGAVTIGTLATANKGYSLAFNAGGTIANAATFLNTGAVALGNDSADSITFTGGLDTASGPSRPSAVSIAGTVATANAALTLGDALNGSVTLTADATLDAGTGTVSLRNLAAGAHNLTVTADEIELLGGADAVTGAGTLILQPKTAGRNIEVAGAGGTAALDLTAAELASLRNGFSGIAIGRPDGAGTITVAGPVAFDDPVTLRAPGAGGRIVLDAQLTGADDASITIDGFDPTTLNANIVTAGGKIEIDGGVVLGTDVTLDTTDAGAVGGADIAIGGAVEGSSDGAEDLTLRAGTGDIAVADAVGAGRRLGALTIASGDAVAFQSTARAVSLEIAQSTSTGFAGLVDLTAGAGAAASGGDIAFSGGLVAGAASNFLNTGRLTLAGATIGGALAHTAGPTTTSGAITAGSIDFAAVQLAGATVLETALGGNVTVGAVDGPHGLAVNSAGTTTFSGTVSVAELATDAGGTTVIDGGVVTTSGGQSYGDDLSLGADTVLTSTGTGDIDLGPSVTGAHAVTVDTAGATVLRDLDIASLETKGGGTTSLNGTVTTTGGQTYRENVTVDGDSLLTSTGAGDITFAGTIGSAGANALTVDTSGLTRFDGAIGGGGKVLGSLSTGAGGTTELNGGSAATAGDQTYADGVTLGADTVLSSTGGGTIALAAVNGARRLDVATSGTTRFGGAVSVAQLATDAGGTTEIAGGIVTTSGGQTYSDAVSLAAATTLVSTGAGDIDAGPSVSGANALTVDTAGGTVLRDLDIAGLETKGGGTTSLNGTVRTTGGQAFGENVTVDADSVLTSTGAGDITFAGTIGSAGAKALTVDTSGLTRFDGAIGGGGNVLRSLSTGAGGTTELNGGSVTTTGNQTYADGVTLGADTVLSSTGGGTIALAAVNGARSLDVDTAGTTRFGGAVSVTRLATDAGGRTEIAGGSVTTSGGQTYNDEVALVAATTLVSTGAGEIDMGPSVTGANALTIDTAGTTILRRLEVASLETKGGGATSLEGTVKTANGQVYGDAVALAGDATLTGATIAFLEAVDGARALTLNGAVTLTKSVGAGAELAVLDVDGATTLAGDVSIKAGAVSLGAVDGNRSLAIVSTTGATTLGDVGKTSPLKNLAVESAAAGEWGFIKVDPTGGQIRLTTAGGMVFENEVSGNAVIIRAAGDVTDIGAGAIKANRLEIASAKDVTLDGSGNAIARLDGASFQNATVFSGVSLELGNIKGTGDLVVFSGGQLTSNPGSLVEMDGSVAVGTTAAARLDGIIKAGVEFDFAAAAPLTGSTHRLNNITAGEVVVVFVNVGDGILVNDDVVFTNSVIGGKTGAGGELPDFQSIPTGEFNQVTGRFNGVPFGSRDFVARIAGSAAQIVANLSAIATSKEEQEKGDGIQTPAQQAFSVRTNRRNYASDVFQQRYEVVGIGEEGRATFEDLSYVADGFWEGLLK